MKPVVVNRYREPFDIYIGRGSKWGNPFTHKSGTKAQYIVSSREEAIEKYREYILSKPELLKDLPELAGKRLGCFCKPKACHGDVLVDLFSQFVGESKMTNTFKTFNGMQYLAIDIANHYGLDKLNYEDRIKWVKDNISNLESLKHNADEPELYWKAVNAFRKAQDGQAIGHTVAFDSASSGLQLMSVVMRCFKGANITGLVDPNNRMDAYTAVTNAVNKAIQADGLDGVVITRKQAKEAVMTGLYGSRAVPSRVFGEYTKYFYDALLHECTGAYDLLHMIQSTWNPEAEYHSWVMPDGHVVYVPVVESQEKRLTIGELKYTPKVIVKEKTTLEYSVSNIANVVHSIDAYVLRQLVRRCNYSVGKLQNFLDISLQVNYSKVDVDNPDIERFLDTDLVDLLFIDNISRSNIHTYPRGFIRKLRNLCKETLSHKPFEIVTIHDSFACHPNNMNQLRYHYNAILADLADSRCIDDILSQLGYSKPLIKYSPEGELSKYIMNSNYGIC